MALGDVGLFLPAESQYKTPGAYDELLKAEATKRANYLSSMDQFYAQLEETTRQFNETLAFKETELSWEKERFGEELAFQEKELASEETYRSGLLGLEREKLAAQKDYWTSSLGLEEKKLDIEARAVNAQSGNIVLGGPTPREQWDLIKEVATGNSSSDTTNITQLLDYYRMLNNTTSGGSIGL